MAKKKAQKVSGMAILLDIMKEMARPRTAKSVREQETKQAAPRFKRKKRGKARG
jgi:hypothetical protein